MLFHKTNLTEQKDYVCLCDVNIVKIAVTKLEEKSEGIKELFSRYGHEAVIVSTMRALDPADIEPLLLLCSMIQKGKIDILIFTSSLGVAKLFDKVMPGRNLRIVSVGPKTAKKVREYGFKSEVIEKFSSEHFADYLGDISEKTIGIARADVPNPALLDSLKKKGAFIIEAPSYRLEPSGEKIHGVLNNVEAVIFTSAKSFELSGFSKDEAKMIKSIAIGNKTAEAMIRSGIKPDFIGNGTLEDCLSAL